MDTLSVKSSWQTADTRFLAHRYEESLAQATRTLELDATHSWSFRTVGQCLEAIGRRDEAIEAYLKAGQVALGHLGRVYALAGRRNEARELLKTLTRQVEETGPNGVAIAFIHTGLGESSKAVQWLEKTQQDGVRLPFSLRVSPQWDPLRASRSFIELLQRSDVAGI
jgi:tetratricopeptide (TPR) repeat protein